MAVSQRRYSKEELARRGQELYESGIQQQVEVGNDGKIVAIDIETGAFATLNLPWSASDILTLGDGSQTLFDIYTAMVIWDGQYREIDIAASETEPLLGMALL
ncbi:hypothetical protein [Chamaesiphon sp.]|uniref:hypothetical protein n=1 Tax=Chamaesiphon sp. TaxID=2814140 RepID=UPI003593C932